MFLDEELLQMCKNTEINTPEAIQRLNVDLCKKCEDYYKSKLNENMHPSHIKTILDRVFNLWDSFVKMAKKDEDEIIIILGDMFEKHSFKKQFLQNEEMKRIYNKLG